MCITYNSYQFKKHFYKYFFYVYNILLKLSTIKISKVDNILLKILKRWIDVKSIG